MVASIILATSISSKLIKFTTNIQVCTLLSQAHSSILTRHSSSTSCIISQFQSVYSSQPNSSTWLSLSPTLRETETFQVFWRRNVLHFQNKIYFLLSRQKNLNYRWHLSYFMSRKNSPKKILLSVLKDILPFVSRKFFSQSYNNLKHSKL